MRSKSQNKCSSLDHQRKPIISCSHPLHLDAALHFVKCLSELKARCSSVCLLEAEVSICHPVFRFSCKSINLAVLQQQYQQVEG